MKNRAVKVKVTVEKSFVPLPVVGPKVAGSLPWKWTTDTPTGWIHKHGLEHIMGPCLSPMCATVKQMILGGFLVEGKDF